MALRTVGARLTLDVSAYMSNLKRAGAATKDFAGQLDKNAKAGNLDAVADRAGVAGIALAGMAGYAVKAAADFDKAMSGVRAATHASTKDITALREAALQAGKDTAFSATEAADGITELSKAGVATSDILKGGLKGALDLAAAGQLGVGEAAETAASAMTQFKLSGKDVPHIADLLAAGAGKAQGSVHDMGMALSQSGLVANQFGLSIEESTGTLAAFASAGLTGSDAGTSFKQMLLQLANPAEKTRDLMEDLGIQAYNAQGRFVGIANLAEQLKTKLSGLTQAQRDAALAQIFGSDAIRSANVLYEQGAKGIEDWTKKVNDQGYAAETARIQTDNLAGDIERLKGSIETLAIESGSGANGGLRVLVKSLDSLVGTFSDLPPAVGSSLTILAAVGGASALALAAFIKLRKGLASATEELNAMGPAGARAATGLNRVAAAASKVAGAFVALEIVGAVAEHFGAASANVDKLTTSLTNLADTGKTAGELSDVFGDNLKDLGKNAQAADAATHGFWGGLNDLTSSIPGVNSLVDTLNERIYGLSFNQATENMQALDQALTDYMTTTGDARKSSELWNRVLSESGLDTQQLADLLPNAWKKIGELNNAQNEAGKSGKAMADGSKAAAGAAGDVAKATPGATEATKEYKTAAEAAADAAKGQKRALSQLSDFMKAETDPVFGFIDAQNGLKKAQENATKAIKEHGKKSEEAKKATRDLAEAAINLQDASGNLAQNFDGKLSPALRNTLRNAGLNKTQLKILEDQFKNTKKSADKYDGKYEAKTSAPGAKDAKKQLDLAYTAANHFAGPYIANVRVTGQGKVEAELTKLSRMQQALKSANTLERLGDGPGFYAGGYTGPGPRSQPAGVVHADEQVINSPSRRSLEAAKPGALDYMNRTGKWPGYAVGGYVWPFPVNASKTKIPQAPAVPGGGGPGYRWMEAVVRAAFPGMPIYSDYRPGAVTLTGNRSYHGFGRAVDFAPSLPLAEWINLHYMRQTKELITPWQSLNIHNGRRHHYSALIENQHNFAGGNAHDHWAMKHGGSINEPIFGVGASGRTYSFGENYQPERVVPNWQGGGGGGSVTVVLQNHGVIASPMEAEAWLSRGIDNLRRKGRI